MTARDLQSAADSVALTSAFKSGKNENTDFYALAQKEILRNGFQEGEVDITVHSPPLSGNNMGDNTAVEITLSYTSKRFFSALYLSDSSKVTARAVARRTNGDGNACILALDASSPSAIDIGGNAVLSSGKCVMAANSGSESSINLGGNSTLTLDSIYTAGGIDDGGANNDVILKRPAQTNRTPLADPYASLEVPSLSNQCAADGISNKTQTTLQPGTYCNGLTLGSKADVILSPGTYIIQGDLDIGAQAKLSGDGVTLILVDKNGYYGNVKINGGSQTNLVAQSTGDYKGLVIMQDRNAPESTSHIFNGGSEMNIKGGIYMPNQNVQFNGNSELNVSCLQLVAGTITFKGTSNFEDNCEDVGTEEIPTTGNVVLAE